MTFAEKVRNLRKEKGLSQTELGQAVGVSLRTVRGWEIEGRYPKARDLYPKLAEVLGCDVSYLMTEKEDFITDASASYGPRGARKAAQIVEEVNALFAGGEMDEEDMDTLMLSLHEAYMEAKLRNKKYTPKKYRQDSTDAE